MRIAPCRRHLSPVGHDDRGDTLVEILVAVVIIALSATAILGSLLISINSSGQHRYLANDDTLARSALDTIKQKVDLPVQLSQSKFSECSGANNAKTILTALQSGITLPSSPYAGTYSEQISGVQCFKGPTPVVLDGSCYATSSGTGGVQTGCSNSDSTGLLQVSVTVQDPSNYTVTMSTVVRNPAYNTGGYSGDY